MCASASIPSGTRRTRAAARRENPRVAKRVALRLLAQPRAFESLRSSKKWMESHGIARLADLVAAGQDGAFISMLGLGPRATADLEAELEHMAEGVKDEL